MKKFQFLYFCVTVFCDYLLQYFYIFQIFRAGDECNLKEADSDPEDQPVRPYRFFRHKQNFRRGNQNRGRNLRNQRQPRERSAPPTAPHMPNARPQKNRQSRTFHRKPATARSSSAKEQPVKNAEPGNVNKKKQQNVIFFTC